MLSRHFNFMQVFRKPEDLLRVYRGAFDKAAESQNPDEKISAFNQVINYCSSSGACRINDSIKRNMVMYWSYNNLGDAWVAKTYETRSEKEDSFVQAVKCYQQAVKVARDNSEKINSLQRLAAVYQQTEDSENLSLVRENIVNALSDEYKRLGYMRLVQHDGSNIKATRWLENALNYVTKEEVSFLNKCQNTLAICDKLAQNYRRIGDKENLKRINRLLNKTVVITIKAIENKVTTEKNREKQLEWYGKMLEITILYGSGDRKCRQQVIGKIAQALEASDVIQVDGMEYRQEMLKAMMTIH